MRSSFALSGKEPRKTEQRLFSLQGVSVSKP